MEMRVSSNFIRTEREKRAWSQEHLARVTGLGLRTINRIETTGKASPESVKALASVFEIEVLALQADETEPAHIMWLRRLGLALITPIQLVDRKVSAMTNLLRLAITFAFLGAAIVCYILGVYAGFLVFIAPALIFELIFYYRLIQRSKPLASAR